MRFLAVFIDGQNGFGCYNMIASYPQGDSAGQEMLLSSIESFQCLGPAGTSYKLFSNEVLSFKFMYADEEPALEFDIKDGILTAISVTDSDYFTLTVSALPLASTGNANAVLGQVTEGLDAIYPGIEQLGEQTTQESGEMKWVVQRYINQSEEMAVYMSYSVSVWQEQAYLIIFTSSQESQLDHNGLKTDVMGSLRPAV